MSFNIWTLCEGDSKKQLLSVTAWRVVEAQHRISTRKLVDSSEEQALLEQLIDESKPPARARRGMHYLLSTPFRYPPLRYGSRFGNRQSMGIWYGAEELRTALAEVAYYRFLFTAGTSASLGLLIAELTAFTVAIKSKAAVDLTAMPFAKYRAQISSPTTYETAQQLGADMRGAEVQFCRFSSARDPQAGNNVAVFDPAAFGKSKPRQFETWHLTLSEQSAEFFKSDYFERVLHTFSRGTFLVDGVLPSPAA